MRVLLAVLAMALALGSNALADTLVLTDGEVLQGKLTGLTSTELVFLTSQGALSFPLAEVGRVEIDWAEDPKPRVEKATWERALAKAQRDLTSCRYVRQGLVLGGLAFVAGGYWLGSLGYGAPAQLISGLGAIGTMLGLISPAPSCEVQAARLRLLLQIGLDHNWLL